MRNHFLKRAFTLVELIVVVTILSILGTIGFVSYSSYLWGVRDASRVSMLKTLSDWIKFSTTKWGLPIPDDAVTISSWWNIIWYQGNAGDTVLESVDYKNSWVDPQDKTPFTYYLSENRKYHQLMAFLEEPDYLQSYHSLFPQVNAVSDFSTRYAFFAGEKLGILTDPITFIPAQNAWVDIDLASTTDEYEVHLWNNQSLSGDNTELLQFSSLPNRWGRWYSIEWDRLIYVNLALGISRTGLVWEYHFDGNFNDSSWLWNHGTVVWATAAYVDWEVAEAMTIVTTTPYGRVLYDPWSELDIATDAFTISIWFKSPSLTGQVLNNYTWATGWYWTEANFTRYCWVWTCTTRTYSFPEVFDSGKYYSYISTYDWASLKTYIDGILIEDFTTTHVMSVAWRTSMSIAWSGFEWQVDQLRIYNRALSSNEVRLLYKE